MKKSIWIVLFLGLSSPATAQDGVRPSQDGDLAIISTTGGGGVCYHNRCVSGRYGIPVDHFALAADVRRSEELALIAAAMRDAIPNPGDAFAINLQLASNGGAVAAALGVGLALGGDARFNFNVGRSLGQTIVAGGLNLSF